MHTHSLAHSLTHTRTHSQISDFGMAQRVDIHVPHEGGKFPIKWTAPEALKDSVRLLYVLLLCVCMWVWVICECVCMYVSMSLGII